ncbi:xeroderma pigmentosum group C-complementing protein [Pseudoscourfieldia marina]
MADFGVCDYHAADDDDDDGFDEDDADLFDDGGDDAFLGVADSNAWLAPDSSAPAEDLAADEDPGNVPPKETPLEQKGKQHINTSDVPAEVVELLSSDEDEDAEKEKRKKSRKYRAPNAGERRAAAQAHGASLLCGLARGNQLALAASALVAHSKQANSAAGAAAAADDDDDDDDAQEKAGADAAVVCFLSRALNTARATLLGREFVAAPPSADGWNAMAEGPRTATPTREDVAMEAHAALMEVSKNAKALPRHLKKARMPLGVLLHLNRLVDDDNAGVAAPAPISEEESCVLVVAALRAVGVRARIVKVHRPLPTNPSAVIPRRPRFDKVGQGGRGRWLFQHRKGGDGNTEVTPTTWQRGKRRRGDDDVVGTFVPIVVENAHLTAMGMPLGSILRRSHEKAAAASPILWGRDADEENGREKDEEGAASDPRARKRTSTSKASAPPPEKDMKTAREDKNVRMDGMEERHLAMALEATNAAANARAAAIPWPEPQSNSPHPKRTKPTAKLSTLDQELFSLGRRLATRGPASTWLEVCCPQVTPNLWVPLDATALLSAETANAALCHQHVLGALADPLPVATKTEKKAAPQQPATCIPFVTAHEPLWDRAALRRAADVARAYNAEWHACWRERRPIMRAAWWANALKATGVADEVAGTSPAIAAENGVATATAAAAAAAAAATAALDENAIDMYAAAKVPSTLAELKTHPLYICGSDLGVKVSIRPGAKVQALVKGKKVYLRSDVGEVHPEYHWRRHGRAVKSSEKSSPASRRAKAGGVAPPPDTGPGASFGGAGRGGRGGRGSGSGRGRGRGRGRGSAQLSPPPAPPSSSSPGDEKADEKGSTPAPERDDMVPLYGEWQTEPLVLPRCDPSIDGGRVPRTDEEYPHSVDCFPRTDGLPPFLPPGSCHVRHPHAFQAARRLGIDAPKAIVGFERTEGRFVPKHDGVVICEAFSESLLLAAEALMEEKRREQQDALVKKARGLWQVLLTALRTKETLEQRWGTGEATAAVLAAANSKKQEKKLVAEEEEEEEEEEGDL